MKKLALALALTTVISAPAFAGGVYVLYPHHYHHAKAAASGGSSSGNWTLCPTPAGLFICVVTVAIIVHEVLGPACARPGLKDGYDEPRLWRPLCRKTKPVFVGS